MIVTRAEILEVLEEKTLKVIRATVDPRTCKNFMGDKIPHPGGIALLLQAGDDPDDLLMVAYDDQVERQAKAGEERVYSYDKDGNVLASVYCNAQEETVINAGEDWAIQFTEMKKAFDQLKADHDNLASLYNAHIHITTATVGLAPPVGTIGVIAPTLSTSTPSTADMTPAKLEKVRVP
jgi:hypothetical protein